MVCGRLQRCRSDGPCYAARWLCLMELLSSLLLQGVQGRVLRAHTWVRPTCGLRLANITLPCSAAPRLGLMQLSNFASLLGAPRLD
ncbi:hypothetical protein HaLaN_11380 [Haematococcus lacustris]|uniref:Secreted protein n=1 Tax=Haematococcus lacustris TaxID=44745 RepID=A0A699Z7E0_HAELA|nr:hypothetical protein HaLaN_11380 [Haematococcus lacustris]